MKTVGIAIDDWKLPVFKRHLDRAGYSYTEHPGVTKDTEHPGVTKDTLLLKVKAEFVSDLQPIIEAAQKECRS